MHRVKSVVGELARKQILTVLEGTCIVVLGASDQLKIGRPVRERLIRNHFTLLIQVKQDAFEFATMHGSIQFKTLPDLHNVHRIILVPQLGSHHSLQNFRLQPLLVQI